MPMGLVEQVCANLEIDSGEMAALVGPSGLWAALAAAGYQKDDIPRLGRLVLEHLRPTIGSDKVEQFLSGAPSLRG